MKKPPIEVADIIRAAGKGFIERHRSWLTGLTVHRHHWVVHVKPPFGGPQHVLKYLAHYTHRVAISNHRLVSFTDGRVTFRWKDYKSGGQHKLMTLTADEFLRRFLLHTLPRGFVRIRFFGFMANRRRAALLPVCIQVLDANPQQQPAPLSGTFQVDHRATWPCPRCGAPMLVVERLTAQQVLSETLRQKNLVDTS